MNEINNLSVILSVPSMDTTLITLPKIAWKHAHIDICPPSPPQGALPLDPAGGCAPRPLPELARCMPKYALLHSWNPGYLQKYIISRYGIDYIGRSL